MMYVQYEYVLVADWNKVAVIGESGLKQQFSFKLYSTFLLNNTYLLSNYSLNILQTVPYIYFELGRL
jgi:hypothetical protein